MWNPFSYIWTTVSYIGTLIKLARLAAGAYGIYYLIAIFGWNAATWPVIAVSGIAMVVL